MEKDPTSRLPSPFAGNVVINAPPQSENSVLSPMNGGYEKMCGHIEPGIILDKLSSQLLKSKPNLSQCEDCANDTKTGLGKDSKGRSSQKKAARLTDSASTSYHQDEKWVCLACGHVGCATLVDVDGNASLTLDENRAPTSGHAWKHSLFARHPLALQAGENLVCWCFSCNMVVEFPMTLNSDDTSQLVSSRNLLQAAAGVVKERLSRKRGFLKDSARICYTMEPVRSVIETVRGVIDSATHVKMADATTAVNPCVSVLCIGSGKKRSVKGLMNLGNTCFFNSVVQNLLALDVLQDHFSQDAQDNEGPLTTSLRHLYQEVNFGHVPLTSQNSNRIEYSSKRSWRGPPMCSSSSEKVCNPYSLFDAICSKAPRFRGFQQQDSHELLRCLLEGLNLEERGAKDILNGDFRRTLSTSLSKVLGSNVQDTDAESANNDRDCQKPQKVPTPPVVPTFVESVFGGQLSSTVHCCECGHSSVVHETMLDLSLQIPTKQILKKRQAHENQAMLSLSRGRSDKGSSYEDAKLSDAAPMIQDRIRSSVSQPEESKGCLLGPLSFDQAEWMDPLRVEMVKSSTVSLDDKNPEECYLRKSFDAPYHSDNRESMPLPVVVGDCISGDAVKAEADISAHGQNIIFRGMKVDMQDRTDSPSADRVFTENFQNGTMEVEDKHDLKVESSKPGMGLPLSGHSQASDNSKEEKLLSEITLLTAECNHEQSLCLEGRGSNSMVETKEGNGALPQAAETSSYINHQIGASKGQVKANGDKEKASTNFTWGADGAAPEEAKVGIGPLQIIDDEDDAVPLSLEDCLADFTELELLCGDNAWECENCSRPATSVQEDNTVKTSENQLSAEVMGGPCENISDTGAYSNGRSCDINQSTVSALKHGQANDICQELQKADTSTCDSGGVMEGNCPSLAHTGPDVEPRNSGDANLHENFKHTPDDMPKSDQKNKVGTGVLDNGDKSSHADKSASSTLLLRKLSQPEGYGFGHTCSKMLPNLRKEKLSFFSGFFFSKTENAKVKNEQQNLLKRDATKKFLISKPPQILTVHLKRFAQDTHTRLNKLCGHVAFAEFLDLQPYLDRRYLDYHKCLYRLMGIVEHGGSMRSGHYVAYVRGPCVEGSSGSSDGDKDTWYYVSDSRVCTCTLQDVLGREAYLLFYERYNALADQSRSTEVSKTDDVAPL